MLILGYDYAVIQFKYKIAGVFDSDTLPVDYEHLVFKYKKLLLRDHIDKDCMTVVKSFLSFDVEMLIKYQKNIVEKSRHSH